MHGHKQWQLLETLWPWFKGEIGQCCRMGKKLWEQHNQSLITSGSIDYSTKCWTNVPSGAFRRNVQQTKGICITFMSAGINPPWSAQHENGPPLWALNSKSYLIENFLPSLWPICLVHGHEMQNWQEGGLTEHWRSHLFRKRGLMHLGCVHQ